MKGNLAKQSFFTDSDSDPFLEVVCPLCDGAFSRFPSSTLLPLRFAHASPQNTSRTPLTRGEVDTLLLDLEKLLESPECASFIKSALEQLIKDTGRSQHGTTDILKLFKAVKDGRGFDYQTMSDAQARGGGGPDSARISINPINAFANLSNMSHSASRGRTLIHELFHVAGYDHDAMARAVYNLGERFDDSWKPWQGEFPDPQNDKFFSGPDKDKRLDGAYSGFFGNVLRQHCK